MTLDDRTEFDSGLIGTGAALPRPKSTFASRRSPSPATSSLCSLIGT